MFDFLRKKEDKEEDVRLYRCKYCGKEGDKRILRNHKCTFGEVHYENDNAGNFLSTIILLDMLLDSNSNNKDISLLENNISVLGGGGEFSGGGSSGSYSSEDNSGSVNYDSGSSDSGSSDSGSSSGD